MKNIKEYIDQQTVFNICLNTTGLIRPGTEQHTVSKDAVNEYTKNLNLIDGAKWQIYSVMEFSPPPIDFSFISPGYQYIHWWFVKIMPTFTFPMHTDTMSQDSPVKFPKKISRYWVPCQDYIDGHVFIFNNKLIKNYRAWDLFDLDTINNFHGAANLSNIPKISLQIEVHY